MAQPNSIFVTPSTTVVEVLQYQTPYTPVILNSYAYEGQVVSILDGNSSIGVLFSSIVVSTGTGTTFPLGAISTLINQPQGFVTLQSQAPNLWTFLNSFPFRNQYLSAGLYNLTTSTFTVARLSTIQTFTDSLAVEKLVVSGNFAQSSPITLNQTISSFGNVDLYSSFSVYNSSFFSSGLSTLGAVQLFSTVTVEGNVVSYSSLQFLSSVFISGSLSVVGNVSAGLISLSSGLVTRSLEVTGSSISTFLNAGSLEVLRQLDAKSEIRVGGDFAASTLVLENLSTLSSLSIAGNLQAFNTKFYDTVSTQGAFHINTLLRTTDAEIIVNNALILQSTVTVGTSTQINGFLSASFAQLSTLVVLGDFQMTQNNLFYTSTLAVGDNLLTGNFKSLNTRIGETLSTTGSAYVYTGLSSQNLSTLGNTSSLVVYVANSVSSAILSTSGNIIGLGTNTFISGDVNVLGNTFLTQTTGVANTVYGSLIVRKDLIVGGKLQISSITLPQEVIANDFFVSSLNVGGQAVFAFTDITNIQASSIGTGGVMYPAFTMDMSNVLETLNFSTTLLSTLSFQARVCPPAVNSNETFFNISSSLAVGHPNVENRFDIGPLAVTSCNMRVSQVLSTSRIESDRISGLFQGDGSQLSNTNYRFDIVLKDLTLQSTLFSPSVETSSFTASTIVTTGFIPTSTFQVNQLSIFGETAFPTYVSTGNQLFSISTPYIAGVVGDGATYAFPFPQGSFFDTRNQVRLNTLMALGNNLGTNTTDDPRGVIINYDKIKDLGNNYLSWTLAVGGTLRVDSLPGVPLTFDEFRGDELFLEGGGSFYPNSITPFYSLTNSGTTYVSSASINISNLVFLGDTLSTSGASLPNIIQTNASTLVFNSTLFVNRLNSSVGINTQPNFTLDVKDSAGALNIVLGTSSIIQNQIECVNSPAEPVWLAVVGSDPYLRYAYIEDTNYWQSINLGTPIYNIFTTGGRVTPINFDNNLTLSFKNQSYIALGFEEILVNIENIYSESSWLPTFINGFTGRTRFADAEFNGVFWVAVGVYSNDYNNYQQGTIVYSEDDVGDGWTTIKAGGFNVNTNYAFYSQTFETGGRSVAWNGELWVAVGQGSNSYTGGSNYGSNSGSNLATNNSILYSADGSNWSNASSGFGFTENVYNLNYSGGFGVVWTGINWVAVGFTALDTGILLSSDGKTWREVTGIGFSNYYSPGWGTAIAWNGNRLVASGYGSNAFGIDSTDVMLYSDTHGESWLTCSGDMIQASNIVWNGSYWLACGYNGVTRSEDGYQWTFTGLTDSTYGLMYNSNAVPVLQVGLNTDLLTVETVSAPPPFLTVAVGEESSYGEGNTMYYSSNGSNWTLVSGPKLTGAGNAVANGGGLWVAVGGTVGGTSNLYTSPDGQSWSPVNLDSLYFYYGNPVMRSVAYLNNIWLVGTDFDYSTYNSIIYSSNGTNWNAPIPSYFGYASLYYGTYGFAYGTNGFTGGNAYLAVGRTIYYYPALIYSTNLNEWYFGYSSGFFNNTNLNYDTNVYGILYANSTWYAVGEGDYATTCILYSGDATSWSNVTFATADFTAARAIAYNGTKWVAVGTTDGSGNTIKYSGDGTNWSNATGDFTTAAYSVIYSSNLSLWIATGQSAAFDGSDTIKYSGDGETWSNNNGTVFNYGIGVAAGGAGAISSILSKRSFYNRLEVFRDPVPGVTTRLGTPYIAYASTILDLNNACQIDAGTSTNNFKNGTLIYPFNSTLQNLQTTNISQSLSTNEFLFDCPLAINTQII